MSLTLKFSYNTTNVPQDADPETVEMFNFYISDSASGLSEEEFQEKDLYYWNLLKDKLIEKPTDAFLVMLVSVASFRRRKFESAIFFIVRSIIIEPLNTFAYRLLIQYMKVLNYRDLEPMYVVHAAKGFGSMQKYLVNYAKKYFKKDDLIACDYYIQRAICLYTPDAEQPEFFLSALEKTKEHLKNGTYDKEVEELIKNQHEIIKFEDNAAVKKYTKRWLKDSNKKVLARYVSRLLSKNKTCVEIGCHSGALLDIIRRICKGRSTLIGVDPDRKAILYGKRTFKNIQLIHGGAEDVVSGQIELPEKFDVLLLSDICLLLKPEEIDSIFAFAKDRCKQIVIMDDIVNMLGDFSVFRRVYFLHPFKMMLEENGFEIIDKQFLPKPNWANSGILMAERKGNE